MAALATVIVFLLCAGTAFAQEGTTTESTTVASSAAKPDMTLQVFRIRRHRVMHRINHWRRAQCLSPTDYVVWATEIYPVRRTEFLQLMWARLAGRRAQDTHCLSWEIRDEAGGPGRWRLPPHYASWICIHGFEGSWTDPNSPYYGGLQMDLGFQGSYGPRLLRRKGTANHWTPMEQMWVAEYAAFYRGRGFHPWPNTARYCGLI